MKKFSQVFLLLAAVMLAASFFAACGSPTSENGGVSYTFTIDGLTAGNIDIQQGGSADISRTLTASDDSSTAGITFTYVCSDADSGVSVNAAGSLISVAADAVTGVHTFTVKAVKNGKAVATVQFTVTVIEADWALTLYAPESVSQGDTDITVIQYELSAPHNDTTGVTFEISACQEGYTDLEVTYNETRDRFEIAPIPLTAQIGAHTYTIDVLKDGKVEATADLVINVIPQYTLTPSQTQYEAVRGSTLTIQYTLTASDGSSTDGLTVGFWCTSDYDACDLLPGHEDDWTNMTINVPSDAELGKIHSIQMEAQDADFQTLAVCNFTIKVVDPAPVTAYDLAVTITLDPAAPLLDGEYVWIAGSFYGSGNWDATTPPGTILLTKQSDGTWTGTVPNIPIATTSIKYNVYAVQSNTTMSWNISASPAEMTLDNATNGVLNYTVTQWGRPVVVAGNLLVNPSYEDSTTSDNWALSGNHWSTNWTDVAPASQWVIGGNNVTPAKDGANAFYNYNGSNNYFTASVPWMLYQEVPAAANSLTAGSVVELNVWIDRTVSSVTNGGSDHALLIGSSVHPFTIQTSTWGWVEQTIEYTLTAADIVGDNVLVGFQYTPGTTAANSRLGFDNWYFGSPE
ncbi:MAG: hypothetical protein FWF29_00155 [Treponema sp.]|nr:hypothetical protein [Treponema sp.]